MEAKKRKVEEARASSSNLLDFHDVVDDRVEKNPCSDSSDIHEIAPCKVIRIPESGKFLLVESGIMGSGIQNPAFGVQDPAKKGIQNPLTENPFQIVLAAFTRIHATTVECSSLTLSIGAQSELSNPTGFAWNINMAAI